MLSGMFTVKPVDTDTNQSSVSNLIEHG